MKTKMLRFVMLIAILFSALTSVTQAQASAIGCSWNGSVDANWSTPGNWDAGCRGAGGIPGTSDTLTFPLSASNAAMTDDLPAITLQSLSFPAALNYTLNGANPISLTGGIDVQAGNQTINAPLAVANGGVIFHAASGSNLAFGGTLSLGTNNLVLTVDSAAGVTGMQISNTITGSGAAKLTKTGTGNLQIIGDTNSSIFDTDVNAGSLSLGPNPGGAWSGLPWNKKLTLALGTSLNLSSHAVIGSIAGAGNINKGSYLLQLRQMQTTTFTGDISGSSQLTIIGNGAGTLTIDRAGGTLSYTGEINVNTSGILKLVNTTATALQPGFSVPSGTLELTNSHVSAIQLGYSGGGANYDGTLILSGSTASIASQITLVNNSRITSVINSTTDYGRISVTSPVDLGTGAPTFTLQGSYAPNLGETFNILQNTNAGTATKNNATFSGLAQGGAVSFNARSMAADYQAGGNTTFALTAMTDNIPPTVASIVRKSYNSPTPYPSVDFTVTFSESVTGVDVTDFSLTTSGITGAGVVSVSGSGSVYTVFVDTGTGDGTLRLDVPASAVIADLVGNPISGLPFTSGQVYEIDKTAPTILSITRADANPTNAASVDFTITFSEDVTGVDAADFQLTATGVAGSSITTATPVSGLVSTVTVNTGSGNGTIRLDIPNTATITDIAGNPLAGTPYLGGETYNVNKTALFRSTGTQDGWVLESSENSKKGGSLNSTATTFNLGDDAAKKQYLGILSFDTSGLPDDAVITRVTFKVKKSGITGGGNPVTTFQGFMVDIKTGLFGTTALQASDFQAKADKSYGTFNPLLKSGWYSMDLTPANAYINKLTVGGGLTQIRLRFKLDDNNNTIANFLSLFSGNAPAASRPQLIVEYYVP